MDRVLREKCVETLGRMKIWVSNLGKHTHEGGVTLRRMKVKMDHLKAIVKEATKERMV